MGACPLQSPAASFTPALLAAVSLQRFNLTPIHFKISKKQRANFSISAGALAEC